SRQRSRAASTLSHSATSWPASASTLRKRRRSPARPWATTTRISGSTTYPGQAAAISYVRLRGDAPRLDHVLAHLLDQRVDAVEAPLAAQALEEVQAQLAAVDVAVEVEQERLDEQAAAGLERWAHADVDRGDVRLAVDFGAAGVDPVVGDDQARVGNEVGGREAERAAPLVA